MEMFTGAYGDNLQPEGAPDRNRSMQDALDVFMNGLTGADRTALERVSLAVVALEDNDTRAWAGHRHHEVHFSGSMVKVLAMYAAHTLRFFSRNLLLERQPATPAMFFASLSSEFDGQIRTATPTKIKAQHGSDDTKILPAYRTVLETQLDATGKPVDVDFAQDYLTHLKGMLIQQQNAPAAACIHGVAFGFMNAKTADDGFFDRGTERGAWLAGDYLGQWTPVRIASTNDGQVAQATTAVDMAKLVTRMFDGSLESGRPTDLIQMLAGDFRSWFHRELLWPDSGIAATHAKIGLGPLKPNSAGVVEQVVSEALKVHDSNRGVDFVVVWQNLKVPAAPTRAELARVARMVEATINGFQPTV
ncbi:hypothetical protein QWM81_17600 [Streptomyces ficellus]|uniref:Serine hydrolase n=1 Tax=Streptomyces ficellus TaxID=1977088 RepID=A0ABT7Z8K5_9ACTN|nr:hypothetical protein [Streptomyces ficellus]MDN3295832.1 hypothetical protein [Streptomyces ficellus]